MLIFVMVQTALSFASATTYQGFVWLIKNYLKTNKIQIYITNNNEFLIRFFNDLFF
jgi:hypothetical protein